MAIFLKIALGSVLLLLVLGLSLWWWARRWFGRNVGRYLAAAELIAPRYARPARIQLVAAHTAEASTPMQQAWARCHGLGFELLADLEDSAGAFCLVRSARHTRWPFALVLTEEYAEEDKISVQFAVFALTTANQLIAVGNGPEPAAQTASMQWLIESALPVEQAVERLQQLTEGQELRAVDLRLLQAVYERAHAARMDAQLTRAPQRAEVEQRARELKRNVDSAALDQALALSHTQWLEQIDTAVTDHYRRGSGLDAVAWERIREHLRIVHDRLRPEDIKSRFNNDEAASALVDQFSAQDYSGIRLYRQVAERLPAALQGRQLGEVSRPFAALVFTMADPARAASDEESGAAGTAAAPHLYSATDAEGNTRLGAVLARNSADAKRQLSAMGMNEGKILSESMPGTELDAALLDPAAAAVAAKALREPILLSVARALISNVLVWLPPALLCFFSLRAGPPYGWGDYLGFAYALVASGLLVFMIGPMVLFNQLLRARALGRWSTARTCLGLLRAIRPPAMRKVLLTAEECKILAARGEVNAALQRWQQEEANEPAEFYLITLAAIHDAAGDHARMIAAQQQLLELAPGNSLVAVDLAMSLARYLRDPDAAEDFLAKVPLAGLSELAMVGYHYARGLIAAERGQHAQAIKHFGEALLQARQFQGNPLMIGMLAEVNGFVALSLRALGDQPRADALWKTVLPLLKMHRSSESLIERYRQPG